MSFSGNVKNELLNQISNSRHCRLAELAALLLFDFETENSFAKSKINKLTHLLDIDYESEEGRKALKLIKDSDETTIDKMLIERACCKQAFVKGAFLAAGSITDPEKGYHFEIVSYSESHAVLIMDIMKSFDIESKMVMRKKSYVVYIKDGSMIVDLLNVMGAHISLMNMENVRILKDVRNSINRKVNCETANLNKTVHAAVKQLEDIRYIESTKGLKFLPDNLRQVASIRLEEPEMSLKDLGEKLNPPLGKSGVNHRLRKISDIANELRRSN